MNVCRTVQGVSKSYKGFLHHSLGNSLQPCWELEIEVGFFVFELWTIYWVFLIIHLRMSMVL